TPTISLVATALISSLFVRPSSNQYYFGDFYAAEYSTAGIYPWFAFQQTRVGFDPVFAHYSTTIIRRDPGWLGRVREDYQYRREHPEARPPHTYVEMTRVVNRSLTVNNVTNVNVNNVTNVNQNSVQNVRNLVLARPINQIAENPRIVANARFAPGLTDDDLPRFTRLNEARRQEFTKQAEDLRRFRQERLKVEREAVLARAAAQVPPTPAGRPAAKTTARPLPPPPDRPQRITFARSPLAAQTLQDRPRVSQENRPGRPVNVPPIPDARAAEPRPGGPPPGPVGGREVSERIREALKNQQAEQLQRRQELQRQLDALKEQRRQQAENRTEALKNQPRPNPMPMPRPMPVPGPRNPGQGPAALQFPGAPNPGSGPVPTPPPPRVDPSAFRRVPQAPPPGMPRSFQPRNAPSPGESPGPGASLVAERQRRLEALRQQRRDEIERRSETRKEQLQGGRPPR
ncbi:MAG: hypothetical protein AB7I30_05785, partial [Isosphaeraceae bacterium]